LLKKDIIVEIKTIDISFFIVM
jgi:hypothetical protein